MPLGFATIDDVEARFIAPRCGMAMCHGPSSVFPPHNLDKPSVIRSALVGQKASLSCRQDFYVNRADPAKSFLLAKVEAISNMVACPSGGDGLTRMPNADGKPTVAGQRLHDDELECLRWWVFQIAAQ